MQQMLSFPEGFVWGAGTSAYQIEGAAAVAGRGPSIWDEFAKQPGAIVDGSAGDDACDHYHRYRDDVRLMSTLNLGAYRFSTSWSRVIPDGTGPVNGPGIAFYDRLVDALLESDIEPFVTLYHWDLPAALQARGGWATRETADAFARYAESVARVLGDRVRLWSTHNEPWVAAFVGHLFGEHAPGLTDLATALQVAHHILLSHGLAVPAIRAHAQSGAQIGIVHNLEWVEPAPCGLAPDGFAECDVAAARRHDGAFNRWFLDPVFRSEYPSDMVAFYGDAGPVVHPGDLEVISVPIDYLGINYYTRRIVANDESPSGGFLQTRKVCFPFVPHAAFEHWEVAPEGLYRLLLRVAREYGSPPIFVTENGTPLDDRRCGDQVHDPARGDYLARHIAAVWTAIDAGVDVRGYFVWSLLDNLEWNLGRTKRFGLIYTDYETQQRVIKDSGRWYATVAQTNELAMRVP